jgi:O-antigen ligase
LFIALAIQSIIMIAQSALGTGFNLEGDLIEQASLPRPGGTVSSNPAGFASFIIPILFIAIARWLARGPKQPLYAALALLGTIAVGLTYTRVAWAGYVFGCLFLVGLGMRRRIVDPRRIVWLVAGGCIAAIAFAPSMIMRLQNEPIDTSYDERAGLMRIAFEVISHSPLTGVGPGAYAHRYKAYVPNDFADQWMYTVHNEFLLRAAETGVVGGIAFVVLLLVGFRLAVRLTRAPTSTTRTMALGWSAGLISLAWQMYWVPWTGFEYNALLWLFLGLTDAATRLHPTVAEAQFTGSTDNRVGGGRRPATSSSAPMSGAAPFQGR